MKGFPRTEVSGISVSRMIMGTNWMLGWSHTGTAADNMIKQHHKDKHSMCGMIDAYMEQGVDTMMAPFGLSPALVEAVHDSEQKWGKKIIMVDTPAIDVTDSAEGIRSAEAMIKESRSNGADFCLLHHTSAEKLVNKGKETIERLDNYTSLIRENGMVPGLSAHMPELVTYSDENGYDVETYIQIYNPMGFLMQIEVETIARIINNAKKPVMTIKPMAAGRCTPYVGFNFVWNTIRDCDMVTVGAFREEEVREDIEISLAAIERRYPDIEKRSSPVMDQSAFGKN